MLPSPVPAPVLLCGEEEAKRDIQVKQRVYGLLLRASRCYSSSPLLNCQYRRARLFLYECYAYGDGGNDAPLTCFCAACARAWSVYVYGLSLNSTAAFSGFMASLHACSPIVVRAYSTVFATACRAFVRSTLRR